jgi:hypothetical protein
MYDKLLECEVVAKSHKFHFKGLNNTRRGGCGVSHATASSSTEAATSSGKRPVAAVKPAARSPASTRRKKTPASEETVPTVRVAVEDEDTCVFPEEEEVSLNEQHSNLILRTSWVLIFTLICFINIVLI